jgi:hypothetical protein
MTTPTQAQRAAAKKNGRNAKDFSPMSSRSVRLVMRNRGDLFGSQLRAL